MGLKKERIILTPTVLMVVLISSIAYILGGFLVLVRKNWSEKTLLSFVALSAGLLLSIAILDLIPEGQEGYDHSSLFVLLGFLIMYLVFLPATFKSKNALEGGDLTTATGLTIGMLLHNFFEGLSIGISYSASFELGVFVSIALIIHKIPEGLSYSSVMMAFLNGRRKTVIYLIIQGIFTWVGAGIALILSGLEDLQEQIVSMGLSITAGIFLYLSATALLPLISRGTFKSTPLYFLGGVLLFWILHSVI